MADVDLDEIYESMLSGAPSAISKAIKVLRQLWSEEDWETIEIFAEEVLTDETPKEFLSKVLLERDSKPDFVEDFVASIDGKRIVDQKDFPSLIEMTKSSRESDSEEFNASRCGRASVALNPDCPIEILTILAQDKKWEIRYRVALNPSATSKILDSILQVSYPEFLEFLSEYLEATIALHKNASEALLERLAKSESEIVRTAVACNPHTPASVIERAGLLGVDPALINFPEFRQKSGVFRETRLCWWGLALDWTLADLSHLQINA